MNGLFQSIRDLRVAQMMTLVSLACAVLTAAVIGGIAWFGPGIALGWWDLPGALGLLGVVCYAYDACAVFQAQYGYEAGVEPSSALIVLWLAAFFVATLFIDPAHHPLAFHFEMLVATGIVAWMPMPVAKGSCCFILLLLGASLFSRQIPVGVLLVTIVPAVAVMRVGLAGNRWLRKRYVLNTWPYAAT